MKKICLTVFGIYILFLSAFSQKFNKDTTTYKSERLKLEEVNLVSGYYHQTGNHSAVTGGIGSEKLDDVSNGIDLKFVKFDNFTQNKYTIDAELGVDFHTSASQAYISKTGASKPYGIRVYPSLNWRVEKANHTTIGFGVGYSGEYNYHSYNFNFLAGKSSKDNNREVTFKAQAFFDNVTLIYPSELKPVATTQTSASSSRSAVPKSPRNTFSGSITVSQIINKNMQFALITDIVSQSGLLSLPFHRVYFTNGVVAVEKLPDTRMKFPIGARFNYFINDKIILKTYFRYYTDSWGIKSNTASLELPYKFTSFVSVAPFYRYYNQTQANYFAPYKQHLATDKYYSSNYDLSTFNANFVGVNVRITPQKGVLKIPYFNMIEFRYGHYVQSTDLNSNNIGINLRFK